MLVFKDSGKTEVKFISSIRGTKTTVLVNQAIALGCDSFPFDDRDSVWERLFFCTFFLEELYLEEALSLYY